MGGNNSMWDWKFLWNQAAGKDLNKHFEIVPSQS